MNRTLLLLLLSITATHQQCSTGGQLYRDVPGFRVHSFTSSGVLRLSADSTVDLLVIGAGGAGGPNFGGGGGAGEVLFTLQYALTAGTTVSVTVGASSGASSSFGPGFLANGGGGGGNGYALSSSCGAGCYGKSGGSGGGGGGSFVATDTAPGGTVAAHALPSSNSLLFANAGGDGTVVPFRNMFKGGGGGGAGQVGSRSLSTCGTGGNGIASASMGVNTYSFAAMFGNAYKSIATLNSGAYYVAGGGGGGGWSSTKTYCNGGSGGSGGGCYFDGVTLCTGQAAKAGTGSGGGAGSPNSNGGLGGSGLVLVRVRQCQCAKGQYYNLTGVDGCFNCIGNTYCPRSGGCGDGCVACPTRTYVDANRTTCAGAVCTTCPRGSYCRGGIDMQGCPVGTYGSAPGLADPNDCTSCLPGSFAGSPNASVCKLCSAGGYSDAGASACIPCGAGTYASASGQQACSQCSAGTYSTGIGIGVASTCAKCGKGTYSPTVAAISSAACVGCGSGTYGTGLGFPAVTNCTKCPPGTATPSTNLIALQNCTLCAAGKYQDAYGGAECVVCPANTYLNKTGAAYARNCTSCPLQSITVATASTTLGQCLCKAGFSASVLGQPCLPCKPGTYKSLQANVACTPCPTNTFDLMAGSQSYVERSDPDLACNEVPAFGYSGLGATSYACFAGYYQVPPSTIDVGSNDPGSCELCPTNTWSVANSTVCKRCANNGTTLVDAISVSVQSCACQPGFFHASNSTDCVPCPAGFWCAGSTGVRVMMACRTGGYSSGGGQGVMGDCACIPGKYGNWTSIQCSPCPAGSWCPGGNDMSVITCPAYTSSVIGSANISACRCLAGYMPMNATVSNQIGSGVACVPCLAGFFCLSGTISQCPNNSFSATGSASLVDCVCSPGYYNAIGGGRTCSRCPMHSYCTGNTSVVRCPNNSITAQDGQSNISGCECAPGYYGTAAVEPCAVCEVSFYCTGGRDMQICMDYGTSKAMAKARKDCYCVDGYVGSASEGCTACRSGTYTTSPGGVIANISCVGCMVGKYATGTAAVSSDVCILCASGTYSTGIGMATATRCLKCGTGFYSTGLGMPSLSNCTATKPGQFQPYLGQGNVIIQYFEALTKVPYVFTNFFVSGTTFPIYYSRSITRYPKRAYTYYNGDSWLFANELSMAISYVYWPDELSNMTEGKYYAECESGLYSSTSAASTCTDCAAGTYASQMLAGKCDACQEGTYSTGTGFTMVSKCLKCYIGTYSTGVAQISSVACIQCDAGYYSTGMGASAASNCTACGPGTYLPEIGSGGPCSDCAAGLYSTAIAAADMSTCQLCGPGTLSLAQGAPDASFCMGCGAGTFSTGLGASASCTLCAAGKFSTATGAVSVDVCTDCGVGTYSSGLGVSTAAACESCAPGYFSGMVGASNAATCQICGVGSYSSTGASLCTYCTPGSVLSSLR